MKKYLLVLLCSIGFMFFLTAEPVQVESTAHALDPSTQEKNSNASEESTPASDKPKKNQPNPFIECPNALGFYANYPLTGGITYHRWFNTFGLGVTVGGWIDPPDIDYNIQVALQGLVFHAVIADSFSLGLYVNGTLGHRGKKDYSYNMQAKESYYRYTAYEYAGIGVGMEFLILKHISLTTEVSLFAAYPWKVLMGGGGGLKIRF